MIFLQHIFTSVAFAQSAAAQSSSPVAVLGLNAKLFIAQLINFAVVLFILWKWVFTPVAKKLQERTDRIEKAMNDADRVAKEKAEFEKWRQEQMGQARQEASVIITKAEVDAGKVKDDMLRQAKQEQQKLTDQAKKQMAREKEQTMNSAKSELADLITNATEKILRHKLDDKKDAELVKESLKSM